MSEEPRYARYRAEPPRPFTADEACDDLIELIALTEYVPAADKALREFFASERPIIVCHVDKDASVAAGKYRGRYHLHETLAQYLPKRTSP